MGGDAQIVQPASVADFNALLKNSTFVIVDFWADWCPPCKAVHPLFAKLASTLTVPGHLAFASLNVDDVPDVALEWNVTTMPTFLFFAEGNLASVETNGAVKASTNPGAIMEQDRVQGIKGVDPRALVAVAQALKRAAEARAKAEAAKKAPAETPKAEAPKTETTAAEESKETAADGGDEKTVSGSYSMADSTAPSTDTSA